MVLENVRVFIFLLQKTQRENKERERVHIRKKITEPSGERNVDIGFSFLTYIYVLRVSI